MPPAQLQTQGAKVELNTVDGRYAAQSQAGEESFDSLFRGLQVFGLWALEEGPIADHPLSIGFLSIQSEVLEGTTFS